MFSWFQTTRMLSRRIVRFLGVTANKYLGGPSWKGCEWTCWTSLGARGTKSTC